MTLEVQSFLRMNERSTRTNPVHEQQGQSDMRMEPAGEPIVNALSFDIEEYFHASALVHAFEGIQWDDLPVRIVANMDLLLDILDRKGVKATLFILGWVARRHPRLVRMAASRGHEVACHGLSHTLVYQQTPAEFSAETAQAKKILEDLTGEPVRGYRAASFSITSRSIWALEILASIGFAYDSSIFPILHDRYGIPGAPRMPYRIKLTDGKSLIEFPPSTMRVAGVTLPVGGGGYFRLFPCGYTRLGLRRLNRREAMPMMFYSHPWEIDMKQPRGRVSALTTFRHYHNLDKVQPRLEAMLDTHRFAPVSQVLACRSADLPDHRFGSV